MRRSERGVAEQLPSGGGEHELGAAPVAAFRHEAVCDQDREFYLGRAEPEYASEGRARRSKHLVRDRGGGRDAVVAEVAKNRQLPAARVGLSHVHSRCRAPED